MAGPDILRPGSSWLTMSSLVDMFKLAGRLEIGRAGRRQPPFALERDQAIALALATFAISDAKGIGAVMIVKHFCVAAIVRGYRHVVATVEQRQRGHRIRNCSA